MRSGFKMIDLWFTYTDQFLSLKPMCVCQTVLFKLISNHFKTRSHFCVSELRETLARFFCPLECSSTAESAKIRANPANQNEPKC